MEPTTISATTMVDLSMSTTGNGTDLVDAREEKLKLATQVINILILTFLMFSMGCTIDLKDIKTTFRHPVGFFVGMLSQFVLMPLIGFCFGLAFSLKPAGALSVLILACCPGGTLSNLFTYWTNGDVCLSVCMTSISTAVAIGMMPLNLFIYTRVWTSETAVIPYVDIVTTLVSILIPVAFGIIVRWFKKDWTKYITRAGVVVFFLCIIIAWVLFFMLNPEFLNAGWQLWLCAAFLPFVGYALGYGFGFLLRQPHKKCRTIAFETGSQNVSLATTLTVTTFNNSPLFYEMLFYPALYAVFIYLDSFIVIGVYKLVVYFQKDDSSPSDEECVEDHSNVEKNAYDNEIAVTDEKVLKTFELKQPDANKYIKSD